MTLAIFVELPPAERHDLTHEVWSFGFESDRKELWQSRELESLGLQILPVIANDLVVTSEQFDDLREECRIVIRCCDSAIADRNIPEGCKRRC